MLAMIDKRSSCAEGLCHLWNKKARRTPGACVIQMLTVRVNIFLEFGSKARNRKCGGRQNNLYFSAVFLNRLYRPSKMRDLLTRGLKIVLRIYDEEQHVADELPSRQRALSVRFQSSDKWPKETLACSKPKNLEI